MRLFASHQRQFVNDIAPDTVNQSVSIRYAILLLILDNKFTVSRNVIKIIIYHARRQENWQFHSGEELSREKLSTA